MIMHEGAASLEMFGRSCDEVHVEFSGVTPGRILVSAVCPALKRRDCFRMPLRGGRPWPDGRGEDALAKAGGTPALLLFAGVNFGEDGFGGVEGGVGGRD